MTRRLKAKPEALKARGKLADGTEQGDRELREADRALLAALRGNRDEQDRTEVRAAERDRALDLLSRLERIVTRTGGYMAPEDQDALREARAMLVEHERLADQRKVWRDRG